MDAEQPGRILVVATVVAFVAVVVGPVGRHRLRQLAVPIAAACAVVLMVGLAPASATPPGQPTQTLGRTSLSPPTILRQPQPVRVRLGSRATFSVKAIGRRLHYQWYAAGSHRPYRAVRGATGRALVLYPRLGASGNRYRVVVSNPAGRAISKPSTLTVLPQPTPPVPPPTVPPPPVPPTPVPPTPVPTFHGQVWLWNGNKATGLSPHIALSFRPEPCGFVCSPLVAYPGNDGAYTQFLPSGSYYNAANCDLDLTIDPDMDFECWAVGHVGTGPYDIWVTSGTAERIDYVICPSDLWDDPACTAFRPPA